MAEASVFRNVLVFFDKLGVYDVVLPFLLTFTIFYAILDRTKVLGTEKLEGTELPRKNLNAMVAFVVGFLVVASAQIVGVINEAMPNIVLLILVSISFLLLIGTFYGSEEVKLEKGIWRNIMMALSFIGVVLIFAHAIKFRGEPFLNFAFNFVVRNASSTAVSSIIFLLLIVGVMVYITKGPSAPKKDEKK